MTNNGFDLQIVRGSGAIGWENPRATRDDMEEWGNMSDMNDEQRI